VRRKAVLEAGWRCWARRGYHDISIDDLCAEAGIAKGSFYLYFRDKADLLEALMREEFVRIEADIERITSTNADGLGRLREFAALIDRVTTDAARARIREDSQQLVAGNPAFHALMVEMSEARARPITRWVEEAIASGEFAADLSAPGVAEAFLVLCTGIVVQAQSHGGASAWGRIGPSIERLLTGLTSDRTLRSN
jgi:AcrR family transcriptional regulator